MTGLLFDENLPHKLRFTPSLPVIHARALGKNLSDADLWSYAKTENLVIVTKDADFSVRILVTEPPPRVVLLRFGNLRLAAFHRHLADTWLRVETLLTTHKLVNVYIDRLEAVA